MRSSTATTTRPSAQSAWIFDFHVVDSKYTSTSSGPACSTSGMKPVDGEYQSSRTVAPVQETLADPPIDVTTSVSEVAPVVGGVDVVEEGGMVVVGVDSVVVGPGGDVVGTLAVDGATADEGGLATGATVVDVGAVDVVETASVPMTRGPEVRSPTTNDTAANARSVAMIVAAAHAAMKPALLMRGLYALESLGFLNLGLTLP